MRNLATIRTISAIKPHTNADALELATVDGWTCVVRKGEFSAHELIVYLEVDSFVPTEVAPLLTKPGKEPKIFEGVRGERLRTMRLRGELSQGLVLSLSVLSSLPVDPIIGNVVTEVIDVTDALGVKKWEKPLNPQLAGLARGNFPSFIRKTDQERIQNIFHKLTQQQKEDYYEVTLKLDGSSATYFVNDGQVGVCSRNLELKTDEGNEENSFVKKFNDELIGVKLLAFHALTGRCIALQGELWGSGINGNWEGIADHRFSLFDVYDIDKQRYLDVAERSGICCSMGLPHAPFLGYTSLERFGSVESFLAFANRGSIHNKVAEGVVFKSTTNPDFSFKVINNEYLLGGGN